MCVCVCVCAHGEVALREKMSVCVCVGQSVVSDSLRAHGLSRQAPLSMGFSRQKYWSGGHSLLQGILLTQGSNLGLLNRRRILSELLGKPQDECGGGGVVAKSCLTLAILWTAACLSPLPMGFSRQEYWSGLPFPSPGDLPDPGIKPGSPTLQENDLPTEL